MSSTSPLSVVSNVCQGMASVLLASGIALLPMDAVLSQTRSGSSNPAPVVVGSESSSPNLNEVRFSCQVVNGQYIVMYNPQSQPGRFYPWASPTALGGGWSPERRCNEISRRLEFYRPDGLVELRTGVENGYNTVCVTTETVPACRIVLTVPPGQDPVAIRDRVFNNLLVADSGQQTTAVTAFSGNDRNILNQIGQVLGINLPSSGQQRSPSGIDLRPFLDPADGGTGTQLQGGTPVQSPRLNPDSFR
ncbi:MAG: hypothetical protein IGS50_21560 [Synechococcales cyanobacterium C42_A2020_086]|jgi:hypothetical protein|nr:hypothetical protein [Synechococcales cyanobacterium C42_A2020_086]